ncbi:hypothetical protein UlMin_005053 [Ulmus minor]
MEEEVAEVGLSLIKQLASSAKSSRDKALGVLFETWLPTQTSVSDDIMKKLWKGLFYCVWHADKVPVQTELIDRLSSLLPKLDLSLSIQYLSVFLLTMRREWNGIDVLRLDKFYLLIRRFLHNFFVLLRNNSWDLELSRRLMGVLQERTFLADDKSQGNGVNYHIASIFLEELSSFFPLQLEVLDVLLVPFLSFMEKIPDKVFLGKIKLNMFDVLLKKGKELLEVKKSGEDVDSGSNIVMFGSIALNMGFAAKFYELGSSSECCQGNRKVLFGLHEEFSKLERDLTSLGINISMPDGIDHDEEEVPKLIPIAGEGMELVYSESVEPVEVAGAVGHSEELVLKKCKKNKTSGVSDGTSKKNKRKKKKKKRGSSDSDLEKNSVVEDNENVVNLNDEELMNENINGGDVLPFDESVRSNLQLQFEKIATEDGLDNNGKVPSSCDLSATESSVSKKRKRVKGMGGQKSPNSVETGEGDNEGATTAKSGEKSGKKVKFSMKNNLVWKPQNPLPPQSLRLPPSATPRGSALKKGVPAGPIREISVPAKKVKLRAVSVKKTRKAVKRLKKIKLLTA